MHPIFSKSHFRLLLIATSGEVYVFAQAPNTAHDDNSCCSIIYIHMTGEYGMPLNTYSGVAGTPYHRVKRKYIFIASHRHVQNEDALKNATFPDCVQLNPILLVRRCSDRALPVSCPVLVNVCARFWIPDSRWVRTPDLNCFISLFHYVAVVEEIDQQIKSLPIAHR